jgi:hypothetical protein
MRGRGEYSMARPGKYGLCFIIAVTAIALVAFATECAMACVGARQMAMGGTFVGIADDMSAVYWNPAGIAMFDQRGFHVTSTLSNRDTYNYDDFLVCIWPDGSGLTLGFSLIREHLGEYSGQGRYHAGDWFTCSVATMVAEGFSVGANLRYENYLMRPEAKNSIPGHRWGLDIGLIYQVNSRLSIGCLLQDAGLSRLCWADGSSENTGINIRPGIGYRPNPHTLIALDIYGVGRQISPSGMEKYPTPCLRAGVERWLTPNVAARFGYYGIETWEGAMTCGIGLDFKKYAIDYAYLDVGTVPGRPGLGGTHQIGVTVKF